MQQEQEPGQEIVPPSSEPDAAVSTGSGRDAQAGTPPPPPEVSAGTGGIGTQAEQQGAGAPPADGAPLDLQGGSRGDAASPSGT